MNSQSLIVDLTDLAALNASLVGGKAAQLARLHRYGLPAPDGFALTTAAYAMACDPELAAAARNAGADGAALGAIRESIRSNPSPGPVAEAFADEIRRRGWLNTPLAIRSSAPMEDSQRASFAGIHHSALNVLGMDAANDALRSVWASLWTPQAVAYRERLGIAEFGMAVVVVPMIRAVAAGVAFSLDPAAGRDDQVVINAVSGLADRLVSGQVNGERIVVQADPLAETYQVADRSGMRADLDDRQAVILAELVREAADAFDYSRPWVDVEWVWDGNRFHLVQARPVTARPWRTYPALSCQSSIWSNGNTRDVVPEVMNAVDWSSLRRGVNLVLERSCRLAGYPLLPGAQRAALFQGRLYLNASLIQWEAYDGFGAKPATMNTMLGGHHQEIEIPPAKLSHRIARLLRLARFVAKAPSMRRSGRRQAAEMHAACAAMRAGDLTARSFEALAVRIEELRRGVTRYGDLMFLQTGGGSLSLLVSVLDRHFPGKGLAIASTLAVGWESSVTARQNYDLQELAAIARNEPGTRAWLRAGVGADWRSLPGDSAFRQAFARFIERYGHRGVYESYVRSPRWREDATYLLRQIAEMLDRDPDDMRLRQEAAKASAASHIARLPRPIRPWVRALARSASQESSDRESARNAFAAHIEVLRLLLLEVGRRLVVRGDLDEAGEVVHLTIPEALAAARGALSGAGLRHRVADRKKLCAEWAEQHSPDVILEESDKVTALAASADASGQGGTWSGIPIAAGCARGVARIIRHPHEGHRLAVGEILVAPSTDPAWTPLFLRAGGVAMETGGYLSHGAIVAREFGIPAVANLPGILAAVTDGESLEVNGELGTVNRLS